MCARGVNWFNVLTESMYIIYGPVTIEHVLSQQSWFSTELTLVMQLLPALQ